MKKNLLTFENTLIITFLSSSLIGLFLIYFVAVAMKPAEVKLSEIDMRFLGRDIVTRGAITKSEWRNGHLILTISDDGNSIQVPIFSSLVEKIGSKDIVKFVKGAKIIVSGRVEEYRGELQIQPKKPEDVKIVS